MDIINCALKFLEQIFLFYSRTFEYIPQLVQFLVCFVLGFYYAGFFEEIAFCVVEFPVQPVSPFVYGCVF